VRNVIYRKVLHALESLAGENDADGNEVPVRLHLFGHSLGAAISHDFLYGLFRPARKPGQTIDYQPGFLLQATDADDKRLFNKWRDKAQRGVLTVGALASAASQMPLLLFRSQALVDTFFNAQVAVETNPAARPPRMDPGDIGIRPVAGTQWKIFYDIDDILGFTTRGLYSLPNGAPHPAIMDYQVDVADDPANAHINYWFDGTVIHETAKLISDWSA